MICRARAYHPVMERDPLHGKRFNKFEPLGVIAVRIAFGFWVN